MEIILNKKVMFLPHVSSIFKEISPKTLTALCMYNVKNERRFCNHCCCGNANKYFIIWERICCLRHPACNARAPYCHLWPAQLYNIFQHYLINGTMFENNLLNTKCELWLYLQFFSEIFFFLSRIERYMVKNVYWSSWLKWESNSIQKL
jgi:hypothetical protein